MFAEAKNYAQTSKSKDTQHFALHAHSAATKNKNEER